MRSVSHVLINTDFLFDLDSRVKLKVFFLINNLQQNQEHLFQVRLLAKIFKCVISWR